MSATGPRKYDRDFLLQFRRHYTDKPNFHDLDSSTKQQIVVKEHSSAQDATRKIKNIRYKKR